MLQFWDGSLTPSQQPHLQSTVIIVVSSLFVNIQFKLNGLILSEYSELKLHSKEWNKSFLFPTVLTPHMIELYMKQC
jgi:hypothetical protein